MKKILIFFKSNVNQTCEKYLSTVKSIRQFSGKILLPLMLLLFLAQGYALREFTDISTTGMAMGGEKGLLGGISN